jgi:dissimilatory sulfite reductase (desulfoviridin) alpha/beta subunit
MAKISADDIKRVKALGFLHDKNTEDRFNGRVITRNGKITASECAAVARAAEKFGSGEVAMTTRLTMEIQGIPYENIEPLREYLTGFGLEMGGTGAKIRPIVSCKGTTCRYGLIDTFAVSKEVHERFFKGYADVDLPHKFKIAVGGCPNNCTKPDLNDVGIVGQRVPTVDLDKCRGCRVCQIEKACPIKASALGDSRIEYDGEACNHCGRCKNVCPFKVFDNYTDGYRIYIGGRWGKQVSSGRYLSKVITDREEALNIVEKALLFFRENGIKGERFSDTIDRIGFENVEKELLSNDLLNRKEEILAMDITAK